jgi:hypothetical protein
VGVVGVGVWGGFPLRSNIPRSALSATLDTYNFTFLFFPDNFEVIKSEYFIQNVKKNATLASPSFELATLGIESKTLNPTATEAYSIKKL